MSDILAAMREFRALDDKRRNHGLQGNDEERWNALRSVLKGDAPPAQANIAAPTASEVEAVPAAPRAEATPAVNSAPAPVAAPAEKPAAAPTPAPAEQEAVPAHVELAAAFLAATPSEPAPNREAMAPAEPELPVQAEAAPAPAATAEAIAEPAPADANGYVWHAESGLFWHAGAQHWYEPQSATYYDVNGDAIAPAIAQAAAAGVMQQAAVSSDVAPASPVPEALPIDEPRSAVELEVLAEVAPAAEAAAITETAPLAEAAAPQSETTPSVEETDVSFDLDGNPDDVLELATGAELLHLAADAAEVNHIPNGLEVDPEAHAEPAALELAPPAAFLDQAAAPAADPSQADPWAETLGAAPDATPGPTGGGWEFVVAPVTPGPANPSLDLWASTKAPAEEPVPRPQPALLPFETSRVPAPSTPGSEAEIEAGFDGWGDRSAGPSAGPAAGPAGVVLPWDPPDAEEPAAADEPVEIDDAVEIEDADGIEFAEAIDDAPSAVEAAEFVESSDDAPALEIEEAHDVTDAIDLAEATGDAQPFEFEEAHDAIDLAEVTDDAPAFDPGEPLETGTAIEFDPMEAGALSSSEDDASFLAAPHEFLDAAAQATTDDGTATPLELEDDFFAGPSLSMDGARVEPTPPRGALVGTPETPEALEALEALEEATAFDEVDGAAIVLDEDAAGTPPPWSPPLPGQQTAAPVPEPIARVGVTSLGASGLVTGEHRAVIHTREGVVKRGTVTNVDLAGNSFSLRAADGKREEISTAGLKAVFLMRGTDAPSVRPEGSAVRITFTDGRPLQGWASDFANPIGFFLVPSDAKGLASRVFVYRAAVREIVAD